MQKVNDKPVQVGEKTTRYTFRIVDDPSEKGSLEAAKQLFSLLNELISQPALLQAGPTYVQKLAFMHTGSSWVIHGEAETHDL